MSRTGTTNVRQAGLLITVALIAGLPATGSADGPTATAEISDIRGIPVSSGGNAMLTYEVGHDVMEPVEPGNGLPGARVAQSNDPAAFDGLWADGGYTGFWLAPQGKRQFFPVGTLIEDTYYTNSLLAAPNAVALEPGDRVELAMSSNGWDAPLPWDRERVAADGELEWDAAIDSRQLDARFGATTGEMDGIFVRADVVARGGDVDARSEPIDLPPLIIDLPRTYPTQALGSYMITVKYPYTYYVSEMTMDVFPAIGKAVLRASVHGYIYEAREFILPGGAHIREWHIPIVAAIMIDPADVLLPGVPSGSAERGLPLRPFGTITMPTGGVAVAGQEGGREERFEVAPGGAVIAGAGPVAEVLGEKAQEGEGEGETHGPALGLAEEIRQTAPLDASLAESTDLTLGGGYYRVTVDPNYRGEGVLALRSLRRVATGTPYLDAVSVPYAVINGTPVKLDRSKLIALRVEPVYPWATIGHTGFLAGNPAVVRTNFGSIFLPGLMVDAVYDLGRERYAFVNFLAAPPRGLFLVPNPNDPGSIVTTVNIRSMPREKAKTSAIHLVELPERGPVEYAGEVHTTEFSAPLDLIGQNTEMVLDARKFWATYGTPGYEGNVTVLRAPGPISPDPVADPSRSIEDEPLALVYRAHPALPESTVGRSVTVVTLLSDPSPPAVADPKPIGEPCGAPQVSDERGDVLSPSIDIVTGWLDADPARIYTTVQVADVPSAAPTGMIQRWSMHWRYEHIGYAARASLDDAGSWTFDYGSHNGVYQRLGGATGEVKTGPDGFIRINAPRDSYLAIPDGAMFRDTGAHALWEREGRRLDGDQAPTGANPSYGNGDDYTVGRCGPP